MNNLFLITILFLFASTSSYAQEAKAIFAGGCFWCMTPPFEKTEGVLKVLSGYSGGTGLNPNYRDYEDTGHVEVVEITYDSTKVSYDQLLDVYWKQVNPTDSGGQFCDRGPQYRPVIYYVTPQQKIIAEQSKVNLSKKGIYKDPLTIEILPASTFYSAEEYHQDYYKKNPLKYKFYRFKCGRDQFLEKIWGKNKDH